MSELPSGPIYRILCRLRRETVIVAVMAVPDLPEQLFRWARSWPVAQSTSRVGNEACSQEQRGTRGCYRDIRSWAAMPHSVLYPSESDVGELSIVIPRRGCLNVYGQTIAVKITNEVRRNP